MPKKDKGYDAASWERVKAGALDFTMDDMALTKHAVVRARERSVSLDDLRASKAYCGVMCGKTLVTVLPPVAKPQLLPGRLFSMGHRNDPHPAAAAAAGAPTNLVSSHKSRHVQHDHKAFTLGHVRTAAAAPSPNFQPRCAW